ncbi:MAG TPA: tetratricopeptide repeat protein [Hyphomicrobiaceae bacterium]|nr:tetratricopeptide repeat protein [Hyphomicrobiaceae bacterium]
MLADRYGNALSTRSEAARDAYVTAVDLSLAMLPGAEAGFRAAIAADEGFALAHAGLARTLQIVAKVPEARAAMARAVELQPGTTARERSHIGVYQEIISGKPPVALEKSKAHIAEWPRDAFALSPSCSVFGLIGFSGLKGREVEQLALLDPLARHYGDDWWFRCVHGFAEVEVGLVDKAKKNLDRSLEMKPDNPNGAHIRGHVYYEAGEPGAGLDYLERFAASLDKQSPIHCHISWHVALWSLQQGNAERAWAIYSRDLHPGGAWGPPINVLTDSCSFLFRAEMMGERRRPELWREMSEYTSKIFAGTGVAFAAVHGALAHAMAGNGDELEKSIAAARGPAGEVVAALSKGFKAFAAEDYEGAAREFRSTLDRHEQIGGSRAQRDLIEHGLYVALARSGRSEEAHKLLAFRRPIADQARLS